MNRVARRLYTLCSVAWRALAVSAACLWWRGRSTGDTVILRSGPPSRAGEPVYLAQFWSGGGGVRVLLGWHASAAAPPVGRRAFGSSTPTTRHKRRPRAATPRTTGPA